MYKTYRLIKVNGEVVGQLEYIDNKPVRVATLGCQYPFGCPENPATLIEFWMKTVHPDYVVGCWNQTEGGVINYDAFLTSRV